MSWRRLAAGLAVSALFLAACGSDTDEPGTSQDPEPTATAEPSPEPEPEEPAEPDDGNGGESGEVEQPTQGTIETDYGDITVTDVGVLIGNVDAPFQLQIFADPRCPYCADLAETMDLSAQEWASGDEVSVEHVTLTFLDDGTRETFSARAGNILAVVADQDPANWVAASDAIYQLQPAKGEADPSDEEILEALGEVGVNVDDIFLDAVQNMTFDDWNQGLNEWAAAEKNLPHVPTVFFNGTMMSDYDTFEQLVEQINDAVASD